MYVRSGRIVRAYCSTEASSSTARDTSDRTRARTLWASHAWEVARGRLVGVRLRGTELRVALITPDGRLHWVREEEVLSQRDAKRWMKSSTFSK